MQASITGVTIEGPGNGGTTDGIEFSRVHHAIVERNFIRDCRRGTLLSGSSGMNPLITHNHIFNCDGAGVYFTSGVYVHQGIVDGNNIRYCGRGVDIPSGSNVANIQILGNVLESGGGGVASCASDRIINVESGIPQLTIANNDIEGHVGFSSEYGLYVTGTIQDAKLIGNHIQAVLGTGFRIAGVSNLLIASNDISWVGQNEANHIGCNVNGCENVIFANNTVGTKAETYKTGKLFFVNTLKMLNVCGNNLWNVLNGIRIESTAVTADDVMVCNNNIKLSASSDVVSGAIDQVGPGSRLLISGNNIGSCGAKARYAISTDRVASILGNMVVARTSGLINAPSGSFVKDNTGYIAPGEIRTYSGLIATLTENAFNSLDNPFGQNVALLSLDIYVATGATATSPNIDCGIGSSATTDYTNLLDDVPGESVGVYRSTVPTPGTQTQPILWQSGAGNRYLNMSIKDAAATGMVATYVATVMGL